MNSRHQLESVALNVQVILLEAEIEQLERLITMYVSPDREKSQLAVAHNKLLKILTRRRCLEEML